MRLKKVTEPTIWFVKVILRRRQGKKGFSRSNKKKGRGGTYKKGRGSGIESGCDDKFEGDKCNGGNGTCQFSKN